MACKKRIRSRTAKYWLTLCSTVQELQREAERARSPDEAGGAAAAPSPEARAFTQARRMVLLDAARTDLSACAAPARADPPARPACSGQAASSSDACTPPADAPSSAGMSGDSRMPSDLGDHAAPADAAGVLSAPAARRTSADLSATAAALRSISRPAGSGAAGGSAAGHDAGAGPGGPGSMAGCAGAHAASSPLQGQSDGRGPGGGAARDAAVGPAITSGRDERGSDAPSSAAAAAADPPGGGPTVQQQAESHAALRARLVSLLCAYAAHDPDTGYCQGRAPSFLLSGSGEREIEPGDKACRRACLGYFR